MERDGGAVDRRTLLGGALGTVGLAITGCGTQPTAEPHGSKPDLSSSSTPSALPATAKPSPVTTSVRPRSHPSTVTEPASSQEITKRATVPVLCYHQLRNWTGSDSQYNRVNLVCPPKYFRAHLDALAEEGWTTINPAQYLRHLTAGATLPRKPIMLSFDDGSASQAQEGLVQLAKRGMTGTFFVMTVVLGKPRWMSIRDIHRLADAGMTIGSHTWDHRPVSDLSGRDWTVQLEQSRETLRKASGQSVEHFAYPYGVVSAKAFRHLSKAGYKTAFQLKAKKVNPSAPLYTLRRSLAVSTWSGADLLKHLAKQHP
jgi:peptidoglycan/xylan/chitin deacetylase (PgdA/CDA1 family)